MNKRLFILIGIIIIFILIIVGILIKRNNLSLSRRNSEDKSISYLEILKQASLEESKGSLEKAISLHERLINEFPNSPKVSKWQEKLGDLNIELLFSSKITPGSILYEIKSGDSLAKIAKSFHTTVELLKKANNLEEDKIITGKKLRVWTLPFNIVVDKSQNILILKKSEIVLKTYVVSTGLNNSSPVGNFKIVNKLINPTWFKAGAVVPPESPDNILGTRWMGFELAGYGIHGTTQAESLGQQVTKGCVRMSNSDVEELFTIVPIGTQVTIVN